MDYHQITRLTIHRCLRNCDSETHERKNMVAEVGLEPT